VTAYKVIVKFQDGISHHAQGVALLQMERTLRQMTGLDIRVLKELKGDDSKLRVMMTVEQRAKL
jgi:hypothetical protein